MFFQLQFHVRFVDVAMGFIINNNELKIRVLFSLYNGIILEAICFASITTKFLLVYLLKIENDLNDYK